MMITDYLMLIKERASIKNLICMIFKNIKYPYVIDIITSIL